MSDTSQGPGWWLASDGKWYPPELWTGPPQSGPSFPQAGQPYPGAVTSSPAAGAPPGTVPQGYPYTPYGVPAVRRTNGMAIASLVCSCAGFIFFVPAVLGVIFGFVARSQIRQSGGTQGGDGLALAGIIVGLAWIGLFVILIVVNAANNASSGVVPGLTV